MQSVLHISPVFTPGASGVGTLDFTGLLDAAGAPVDVRDIHQVINLTRGAICIYSQDAGFGAANIAAGPIITLNRDTVGFASGDLLVVVGEDATAASIDRELVVSTYVASAGFTGASIGDTITGTQIIDVTGAPATVSTIWRNQTTGADLGSIPSAANLTLVGSGSALTDLQLRAAPVPISNSAFGSAIAQEGTDSTGVTQLTGGVGIRGWLSGIFSKLSGVLSVSASSLPLPAGAATSASQATQSAALAAIQTQLATSATDPVAPDSTAAILTRELREDNALTQQILGDIANLLLKVFTMTAAGANPSLSVSQAAGANLNATVVQATAANLKATVDLTSIGATAVTVGTGAPAIGTTQLIPVAIGQGIPLSIIPVHLHNAITV